MSPYGIRSKRAVSHDGEGSNGFGLEPHLLALAPLLATVLLCPSSFHVMDGLGGEGRTTLYAAGIAFGGATASLVVALLSWRESSIGGGRIRRTAPLRLAFVASFLYPCTVGAFLLAVLLGKGSDLVALGLGMAAGASLVPMGLAWMTAFRRNLRTIMFNGAFVYVLAATFVCVLPLYPSGAQAAAVALYAVVGSLATAGIAFSKMRSEERVSSLESNEGFEEPGERTVRDMSFSRAWLTVAAMLWMPLVGSLVWVFSNNIVRTADPGVAWACAACVGLLGLALCLVRWRNSLALVAGRLVVPLCIAFAVLLNSLPADAVPSVVVGPMTGIPITFITLYLMCSLPAMARTGEFPTAFLFGIVTGMQCLTLLVSLGAQWAMELSGVPYTDLAKVLVNAYFALVLVSLVFSSWKQLVATGDEREEKEMPLSEAEGFELRLDRMASEAQLTDREREILPLVARGHSSTYIAKTLFISSNTVKTHVRHIYRKLDVTSRDELLTLLSP